MLFAAFNGPYSTSLSSFWIVVTSSFSIKAFVFALHAKTRKVSFNQSRDFEKRFWFWWQQSSFSFHSNLSSLRRKYLSKIVTDINILSCGPEVSKELLKIRHRWFKKKDRKFDFRFVKRSVLAGEARKKRSCQSYSTSHNAWRADRPFHLPTFFRPDTVFYQLPYGGNYGSWYSEKNYIILVCFQEVLSGDLK